MSFNLLALLIFVLKCSLPRSLGIYPIKNLAIFIFDYPAKNDSWLFAESNIKKHQITVTSTKSKLYNIHGYQIIKQPSSTY